MQLQFNKYLISFLLCCTALFLQAQQVKIENVESFLKKHSGIVTENNKNIGTYILYQRGNKDKKIDVYEVIVYDSNLKEVKQFSFEESSQAVVSEISYSDGIWGLLIFNAKDNIMALKMFDNKGKLIQEEIDDFKHVTLSSLYIKYTSPYKNEHLLSTSDGGFIVNYIYYKAFQFKYLIHYYNPKTKKSWKYVSNVNDLKHLAILGEFNQKLYVTTMISRNKFNLEAVDITTGKTSDVIKYNGLENPMNFTNMFPHPVNPEQFIITGNWGKTENDLSRDLFIETAVITMDKNGKIIDQKYLRWKEDLTNLFKVSFRGRVRKIGFLYIHNILSLDGKTFYMLAEGYDRSVDPTPNLKPVTTTLEITDILVFTMNEKYEIQSHFLQEHIGTTFSLPSMDHISLSFASKIAKTKGLFNYDLSTIDAKKNSLQFYYIGHLKDNEKKGYYYQMLNFQNGKMEKTDIPINTDATITNNIVSNPGNIVTIEYFKKKKMISLNVVNK